MLKYRVCSFLSCLLLSVSLMAQNKVDERLTKPDTIPFVLTDHNNIAIKAVVNEKDTLVLMFHTAANDISLTTKTIERMKHLKLDQSDSVKSWGGSSASRHGGNNTVQIGSVSQKEVTIWESMHSGPSTDGKFGPNFFKGHIIEIDFEQKVLVLHTALPKTRGFKQHQLTIDRGLMFLMGKSKIAGKPSENKFLIHSGYGGTLLFDDEYVKTYEMGSHLKVISESELKDSYGNILKTKKAILPSFKLGKTKVSQLPVGFFEGAIGRQKMSVMGGGLLKRFHIILDMESAQIYLKPNELMRLPYSNS